MRIKGWKSVLGFTYLQNVKSKAFKSSTIIMAVIMAAIMVAINLLPKMIAGSGGDDTGFTAEDQEQRIDTVYLLDESGLSVPADFTELKNAGLEFINISSEELENTCQKVKDSEKAEVLLHIFYTDHSSSIEDEVDEGVRRLRVEVYRPENESLVSSALAENLSYMAANLTENALLMSYGVPEESLDEVKIEVESKVSIYSDEPEKSIGLQVAEMLVPMLSSLVLFCFILSYSQLIAQAIAIEKTSRVMELLLTSVSPLAIIVGKVLGMLLVCITQLAIFGVVGGAAFLISLPFGFIPDMIGAAGSAISGALEGSSAGAAGAASAGATSPSIGEMIGTFSEEAGNVLPGLDFGSILLIIVVFVLGFLFYALLAGLVGAGVSRIEDMAQALQPLMLVSMAGFFLSYFSSIISMEGGDANGVMVFARYFPISSPFALPGAILLGQMTILESLTAVLFQTVILVLTAILVAKVYHHIILYSGNPLKFSQIFKFLKKEKN